VTLLYERWQQIVAAHLNERALAEFESGRSWTFRQLAREAEVDTSDARPLTCPQGHNAAFILSVLRAWRRNAVLCPLEPGQSPPLVPHPPAPCVHLKITSATTGAARLVAFTGAQLQADADNIVATMGLRPDWPNLGVISMAHSYGFSNLVLPLLLHGIPLLMAPSPLPETVRRAAVGEAVLTLAGVPTLWRAWHEARAIPANVRLAISAGAPLPLELEAAVFKTCGLKIHNFYGSTECGGIAYDASHSPRTDANCVGQSMANVTLTVEDDGCLVVHGANVGQTYWPEPGHKLADGRFQTSDLAELRDGEVFLRGRAGDLINVAGRKVSPEAIERALREHDAVNGCLVFGVPSADADRGETIVACVVAKPATSAEALRQFALGRLPAWQVPRDWWFVDSLAENQRGKVSRAAWRQRFEQRCHRPIERRAMLDKAGKS